MTRTTSDTAVRRQSARTAMISLAILIGWAGAVRTAHAEGATRDLSDYSTPGVVFTVSIAIDLPPVLTAAGLEDAPPTGWVVSNISDSGTWDVQAEKVKWGPFFDPSIPTVVTYQVAPPVDARRQKCFAGIVTFDTASQSIEGDQCLGIEVPNVSRWGVIAMIILLLCVGTVVLRPDQARPAP